MTCTCGNEARYVDETGALTCALCPIKQGKESWRISDVPGIIKELSDRVAHAQNEWQKSVAAWIDWFLDAGI